MNIDTSLHYIIPKNKATAGLISPECAQLITYASLYTDSLAGDDYDGLTNEDGLKLLITPDTDITAKETGLNKAQIQAAVISLQELGLIRVINQPHGKPPVVFLEHNTEPETTPADPADSLTTVTVTVQNDNTGTQDIPPEDTGYIANTDETTNKEIPEQKYTPEEIEIFGCWEEVFGEQPRADTKTALTAFAADMDKSVLMLAIYDSDGNAADVLPKLENYRQMNIKTVEDFQKNEEPDAEPAPETIHTEIKPITTPAPASRIAALREACNGEFSAPDLNEIWISMQEVINEDKWNDFAYLSRWLKERYNKMDSRVKGGDRFVRQTMLQEIIALG